jgi:hypothetical protein
VLVWGKGLWTALEDPGETLPKGKLTFELRGFAPGWVRLERVWSESAEREIDYFVAGDVESLLYVANCKRLVTALARLSARLEG